MVGVRGHYFLKTKLMVQVNICTTSSVERAEVCVLYLRRKRKTKELELLIGKDL